MTRLQRSLVAWALDLLGVAVMFAAVGVLVVGTLGEPTIWRQTVVVGLGLGTLEVGRRILVRGNPETDL